MQTARLYHQFAVCQRLVGNFKSALDYETKNYEICKRLLGENHLQTMEANIWLTHITRDAVQDAKNNRSKKRFGTVNVMDRVKREKEAANSTDQSTFAGVAGGIAELSGLSIGELVSLIQDPNVKSLNRFGSSRARGAPKRTFPGGASAVARVPKSSTSATSTQEPLPNTNTTTTNTNTTTTDTTTPETQAAKKRKRRKNKKGQ